MVSTNLEITKVVIATAGVIAIIVSIFSVRTSINHFKKQLQVSLFADYTKRYQQIVLNFPESINQPEFDYEKLAPDIRQTTLRYMRAYFDLCSEEYFLKSKDCIHEDMWKEWENGMIYAFSKTAFKKGWETIKPDTFYYPKFIEFIESLESKK